MKLLRRTLNYSLVLGAVAVLTVVPDTNAQVFFADPFDYPDGELTSNDGTGDNVSGGLWVGHSGTTFDDNLIVTGGKLEIRNSGSEDANRVTGSVMSAGDLWYYGFSFYVVDQRSDPNTESINNDYFAHFIDNSSGYRGRIYLDDPNVASPDTYTLGLSASSGGQAAKWAVDLDFGVSYKAVVSYDYDSGLSELWINPVDASSTKISDTNGAGAAIQALAFRQDFITGGPPNNAIYVDVAAIGTDFGAVVAAVPEPSTFALLGFGSLALIRIRRRK